MARGRTSQRSALGALSLQRAGVVYALVVIVVIFEAITVAEGLPPFLALANVRNILNQTAIDGIMAVSMTVLLITGNFDLSVGATAGLAGAVGVTLVNSHGVVVGTLGALGVGLGVGLVNGGLVQGLGVSSFIVTLGSLTALQGILLILTNGLDIAATNGAFSSIGTGDWTLWYPVAATVGVALVVYSVVHAIKKRRERGDATGLVDNTSIVAAVVGVVVVAVGVGAPGLLTQTREGWILLAYMAVVAVVLRFTVVGRRVYAVGGNGEAARLSGVRVARYKIGAFLLTSLSASLAGLLYVGQFGAISPTALVNEELFVLAAAILGGTSLFGGAGYVVKTVVGALILVSLTVGFGLVNLGTNYQYLVQGVVIIAAASVYTVAGRRRRTVTTAPEGAAPEEQAAQTFGEPAGVSQSNRLEGS